MYKDPETGAYVLLGRADGVLNPSGVRFGSAEIYGVVEGKFAEEVEESVCVGQRRREDQDERVMLFVKMRDGNRFDAALRERIRGAIGKELSRRHVPRFVFAVKEIPVSRISSFAISSCCAKEKKFWKVLPEKSSSSDTTVPYHLHSKPSLASLPSPLLPKLANAISPLRPIRFLPIANRHIGDNQQQKSRAPPQTHRQRRGRGAVRDAGEPGVLEGIREVQRSGESRKGGG